MSKYRVKKLERYNQSIKFLNFYTYFLLPFITLYLTIQFTWRATVANNQFSSQTDFVIDLFILCIVIIALMCVWEVDVLSFITNIIFISTFTTIKIISILSPAALGKVPAQDAIPVMANVDNVDASAMYGAMGMGEQMMEKKSILTKIIQNFTGTEADIQLFERAIRCEIIFLIGFLFIGYFISHRKLFFTPLEKMKREDDFDEL